MMRQLSAQNRGTRALVGQGEPGLFTLLGGTEVQSEAAGGGISITGAFMRKTKPYRDMRLNSVAAPGGGAGGGSNPRDIPGRNDPLPPGWDRP